MTLNLTGNPPNTAAMVNSAVNTELSNNWFPLAGVTNGGNASAGNVGEFISATVASGSAVSLSSGVAANVTSISLTAGDWDVWGTVAFSPGGTTAIYGVSGGVGSTSAALPAATSGGVSSILATLTTGQAQVVSTGTTRISISSTTTVYLVAEAFFGTSTMAAYGYIGARRVR